MFIAFFLEWHFIYCRMFAHMHMTSNTNNLYTIMWYQVFLSNTNNLHTDV